MQLLSIEKLKNFNLADLINNKIVRFIWSAILDEKVCLLPETLIFTDKGEKQIKDINIGDNVLCTKGFQPVIAKRKLIKQKYLKITLSNGRILKVTHDHKIFMKGKYYKAKDLKIGDILISILYCNFCKNPFIRTGNKNKFCSILCYRNFQKSGKYTSHKFITLNIIECINCQKKSHNKNKNAKFCSRDCYLKFHSKDVEDIFCEICGNSYIIGKIEKEKNKHFFCSRKCYLIFKKDNYKYHREIQKHRIKKELLNCKQCNQKFEGYINKNKYCSQKCYWESMKQVGKNSDYNKWRISVFKRDFYLCQDCGIKSGYGKEVQLNAHHIKSKTYYPEFKFDVNNGITLCIDCHAKQHDKQQKGVILSQGRFFNINSGYATY